MEYTVYFADKAIRFTSQNPGGEWYAVTGEAPHDITRTKILKILETHNCLAVLSTDPDAAYASFAAEFTPVEAAGGIVVNDPGEWLMIHRNGRWDLPKGHLECGEELSDCAVREVREETGVCARIVRKLCETLHAYYMHGRWELKRTHWYELHSSCADLSPQREEGIDTVAWCRAEVVAEHLCNAYPTIRRVAERMNPSTQN